MINQKNDSKKIKNEINRIFQELTNIGVNDFNPYNDSEKLKAELSDRLGEDIIKRAADLNFYYEIIENDLKQDDEDNEHYGGQQKWRLAFVHK